jgi:DNA-binding CsgD family transcriptional regulator
MSLAGMAVWCADAQIALELGIASASVVKHLEHVYNKPGVETRTAADRVVQT